jgi:hypothetical protein
MSLTSHAASFVWALPRLLVGRTSSQAADDSAAAAASGQQQQGRQQRISQQQQQQQQAVSVSKAWLRQYCWLLQVGVGIFVGAETCKCIFSHTLSLCELSSSLFECP